MVLWPTGAQLDKMPLLLAREDKEALSKRYVSFVLLYVDFWTILVHGRFDDSSHFVHIIDTHYVWVACDGN